MRAAAVALLLQHALVTVASGDGRLTASFGVSWPAFLGRHDMRWRWNASEPTWPSSFETAAWTGNGVYGLAPLVDSASTLRFEIARSDVWQCGMDPRLPIGYLRLQLAGTMMSGFMNQSLVSGAVTGMVTTTAGALEFRAYSPATARLSVLEWSATGGERTASLELVNEQAIGRAMFGVDIVNPAAVCADQGTGEHACVQQLRCSGGANVTSALKQLTLKDRSLAFVSVGSYQPSAVQYPKHNGPLDSKAEALEQVRRWATEAGEAALWEAHRKSWLKFWAQGSGNSFLSIPDTRLEAMYYITQAKLQGAMSSAAAPGGITDQLGPYRGDLSRPANRDPLSNGSSWVGLWFDWNVEENYWGVARANHVELFDGLMHGLKTAEGGAAMRANAEILIGSPSEAMALSVGQGQNLRMTGYSNESAKHPLHTAGVTGSTQNTSLAGSIVFRAVLFASRQIWRACASHHNLTCYRDDLLPLLRGGIAFYQQAPPDLNQTLSPRGPRNYAVRKEDADGLMHIAMPSYSLGSGTAQGLVEDPSLHIALLRWACETLQFTNQALGLHHRNDNTTDDALTKFCDEVTRTLAPPSVSPTHGGLIAGRGVLDNPTQTTYQDMEAYWPVFPVATLTMFGSASDAAIVRRTTQEYNESATAVPGRAGTMNNDLAYTMIAGMNAAAGQGTEALGNLTRFLDTDKTRVHADGTLVEYGCSRPCLHDALDNRSYCAPCVGSNTMVEEGGNPILEGSIAISSSLQDMLLADYVNVVKGAVFLVVFPAVPVAWDSAVFYHFRTLGAFLVSAQRRGGRTAWVQIESEAGLPLAITADFGTEQPVLTSSSRNATLIALGEEPNRWRIEGLGAGGVALLAQRGVTQPAVTPLPAQPGRENYYGYRRDEWW